MRGASASGRPRTTLGRPPPGSVDSTTSSRRAGVEVASARAGSDRPSSSTVDSAVSSRSASSGPAALRSAVRSSTGDGAVLGCHSRSSTGGGSVRVSGEVRGAGVPPATASPPSADPAVASSAGGSCGATAGSSVAVASVPRSPAMVSRVCGSSAAIRGRTPSPSGQRVQSTTAPMITNVATASTIHRPRPPPLVSGAMRRTRTDSTSHTGPRSETGGAVGGVTGVDSGVTGGTDPGVSTALRSGRPSLVSNQSASTSSASASCRTKPRA